LEPDGAPTRSATPTIIEGGTVSWLVAGEGTRVREAGVDDVKALVELMAEFYSESAYVLNQQRAETAFTTLVSDHRIGRVWLIEHDSTDVGYVVVTLVYGMEYGGLMAVIDDLYVRPANRNLGLGTSALAAVRDACSALGVRAISAQVGGDNDSAVTLYERSGFEITERRLMVLPLAEPTHEAVPSQGHPAASRSARRAAGGTVHGPRASDQKD
jgi:ribosomal protein S18 acetylase RimI-like enzyme